MTTEKATGTRIPWDAGTLVWDKVTSRGPMIIVEDDGGNDVKVRVYTYEVWLLGTKDSTESKPAACLTDKRPWGPTVRLLLWIWRLIV